MRLHHRAIAAAAVDHSHPALTARFGMTVNIAGKAAHFQIRRVSTDKGKKI